MAHCDPVAQKVEAPVPRAPVVVAAAPPPKPAPPSAPVKRAPQSINFSADALFAFDKSVLKPEGIVLLDEFVRQLRGAQYDSIIVTGHTDRLGSNEYNQKLSERRANAVKDYLVRADVPANRIHASGKGETQPVTQPEDCKGGQSVKVIACSLIAGCMWKLPVLNKQRQALGNQPGGPSALITLQRRVRRLTRSYFNEAFTSPTALWLCGA